jgi:hypothetical protein
MDIRIFRGNQLSEDLIEMMNAQRIKEYGENTKDFRKNEQQSTFFFAENDGEYKAFGMLKPVTIMVEDKTYKLFGIGNIIAIEKGVGHGRTLMSAIKDYLIQYNMIGLGFCHTDVCNFYRQCEFGVRDVAGRFRYAHAAQDGRKERQADDLDVLYFPAENDLIRHIEGTDADAVTDVPFW